jgi:hypothetical protein
MVVLVVEPLLVHKQLKNGDTEHERPPAPNNFFTDITLSGANEWSCCHSLRVTTSSIVWVLS